MRQFSTREMTLAAMLAAVYAVLTMTLPSYTAIQFRLSEALTVLPFLFPWATPGLFVGCVVANLLSPYGPMDIVIGSMATLLAALWTSHMPHPWLAPLPPVICNAILVGFTIGWAEAGGFTSALPLAWAMEGGKLAISEGVVCYVFGSVLLAVMPQIPFFRAMIPPEHLKIHEKF